MSKLQSGRGSIKQPTSTRTASSLRCSQKLTATFDIPSIWKEYGALQFFTEENVVVHSN